MSAKAYLVPLTKRDFERGCMFTTRNDKTKQFYLVAPNVGIPYIVNDYNKQVYAHIESVQDEYFLSTNSFFGKKVNLTIKFSECFRIIYNDSNI